jgi:hypothetical protein
VMNVIAGAASVKTFFNAKLEAVGSTICIAARTEREFQFLRDLAFLYSCAFDCEVRQVEATDGWAHIVAHNATNLRIARSDEQACAVRTLARYIWSIPAIEHTGVFRFLSALAVASIPLLDKPNPAPITSIRVTGTTKFDDLAIQLITADNRIDYEIAAPALIDLASTVYLTRVVTPTRYEARGDEHQELDRALLKLEGLWPLDLDIRGRRDRK